MINFIVIGICIVLLLAVIYVSAKPISMGIEARRDIKDGKYEDEKNTVENNNQDNNSNKNLLSDEIKKINKLKDDGVLTEEEYQKAKRKLLA
mgnify:CR=1 FL=1